MATRGTEFYYGYSNSELFTNSIYNGDILRRLKSLENKILELEERLALLESEGIGK